MRPILLMLTVIVGTAFAAEPEPTPPSPSTEPAEVSLLAGPLVAPTNVTAATSSFSESEPGTTDRMMAGGARLFHQAILGLREAPEAIRPTPTQQAAIAALVREFQQQEQQFQRTHGAEFRRLRTQLQGRTDRNQDPRAASTDRNTASDRPRDRAAGREPAHDEMMTDESAMDRQTASQNADSPTDAQSTARARLADLLAKQPRFDALEKPIRALLNQEQRAWVDERMATKAQEMFEARNLESYRKRAAEQLAKQPERVGAQIDRLPDRAKRYLESLPESERPAALEKIRDRLMSARSSGRSTEQRTDRVKGQKAPPSIDKLNIPKPGTGG